jgi:hypothetical protein
MSVLPENSFVEILIRIQGFGEQSDWLIFPLVDVFIFQKNFRDEYHL